MSLTVKNSADKHGCNVSSIICHSDFLISGSDDGKIKLSKLSEYQIWKPSLDLVTEFGGAGGILSLAASDNTLYSCSTDETIQSWDLNTGKIIGQVQTTLYQPQRLFVETKSKTLWAGDNQGNVAKFESNGKEIGKFELVEEIWDLAVAEDPTLIYTARDRDVVVTEIVTGGTRTKVVTKATFPGRSPMCFPGKNMCFLNRDGRNVLVYENSLEKKFPAICEMTASDLIINGMAAASDNVIYTGGYDSAVKKWDLSAQKCLGSVNLNCCINAIATRSENEVFIARSDGAISRVGA